MINAFSVMKIKYVSILMVSVLVLRFTLNKKGEVLKKNIKYRVLIKRV